MTQLDSENYSPFEVLTENFGESETAWDDFSYQVSSMSPGIQDLILGITAEEFVQEIVREYSLSDDQTRNLALIIGDLAMGQLFIGDIPKELSQKLAAQNDVVREITGKILNDLLAPAIEDIKKIQAEKFQNRIGQKSASTTPARPAIPKPPAPSQIRNGPVVNQNNVVDLRNNQ